MNSQMKQNSKDIKGLLIYLAGAYIISFLFALPTILIRNFNSGFLYMMLIGIATFGPTISSFITTYLMYGKDGVMGLIRSVKYKFPLYIYLMMFAAVIVFMYSGLIINYAVKGVNPVVLIMVPNTLINAFTAPLGEEFGWRGFMTPRMLKLFSPVATSVIMGMVWAGWHFWYFLIPGQFSNPLPFWLFVVDCISASLWFTWFYMKSGGSILSGMIYHFSYNLFYHIIPVNPEYIGGDTGPYIFMQAICLLTGVLINIKNNSAKKSSYKYGQPV